jgi:MFS transporter, DHA1 family, multidrug resistance protein
MARFPVSPSKGVIVAVAGALSSFGPLSIDLYLPALPRVAGDLGATDSSTQLSVSACLVGLALGQLIFGPLSDKYGRRHLVLGGVAMWTLAALACGAAPDVWALVALRLVQGLGGAAGLVIARAVIRDLFDGAAMARAFGLVSLIGSIAPAVAPVAGGGLLHLTTWRGLFVILAVIGFAMLVMAWVALPESLPPERPRSGGAHEVAAAVRRLGVDRLFVGSGAVLALGSSVLFIYISLSSFVLQQHYGLSAGAFSAVFAGNSIGILGAGWLTVVLLRRHGSRWTLACGLATMLTGVAVLAMAVLAGWGLWAVLPPLLVSIASVGFVFPTTTNLALLGRTRDAGTASALLGSAQFLAGAAAGPLVSVGGASGPAMAIGMVCFAIAAALVHGLVVVRAPLPLEASSGAVPAGDTGG